jgi:hypothetical protein
VEYLWGINVGDVKESRGGGVVIQRLMLGGEGRRLGGLEVGVGVWDLYNVFDKRDDQTSELTTFHHPHHNYPQLHNHNTRK